MPIQSILLAAGHAPGETLAVVRARQLSRAFQAPVRQAPAGTIDDLLREARDTDLVVLPHAHERSIGAFFRGQPVVRLLRERACPVLVSRATHGAPYGHVLVAVNFKGHAAPLARLAADVAPRAQLQVFHAIDTRDEAKLRAAEATEHAVRAYRERCLAHANGRLRDIVASLGDDAGRAQAAVGRGDPGRQAALQQQRCGADLVVVGKESSSAWQDFFCGSVAQGVIGWGTSDVLVVPHAFLQAGSPARSRGRRVTGFGVAAARRAS